MEKSCETCIHGIWEYDKFWWCQKGHKPCCSNGNSFSFWEPKENYIYDGKTYVRLRPITTKSLILDGARDEDVDHFRFYSSSITDEIPIENAIAFCSDCSDKMRWMEEKRYWKVEEEEDYRALRINSDLGTMVVDLETLLKEYPDMKTIAFCIKDGGHMATYNRRMPDKEIGALFSWLNEASQQKNNLPHKEDNNSYRKEK